MWLLIVRPRLFVLLLRARVQLLRWTQEEKRRLLALLTTPRRLQLRERARGRHRRPRRSVAWVGWRPNGHKIHQVMARRYFGLGLHWMNDGAPRVLSKGGLAGLRAGRRSAASHLRNKKRHLYGKDR